MGCGSSSANGLGPVVSGFSQAPASLPPQPLRFLSLAMVRSRSTRSCAWCVIRSRVYDLTPFFSRHPGGAAALLAGAAGQEATAAFETVHGSNPRAYQLLKVLLIGALVDDDDTRSGKSIDPSLAALLLNEDDYETVQSPTSATTINDRGGKGAGAAYLIPTTAASPVSFRPRLVSNSLGRSTPPPGGLQVLQSFTPAEVATHNRLDDCWTIRCGQVFDLSHYFAQQREASSPLPFLDIKRVAGIDATSYLDSFPVAIADAMTRALERGQVGYIVGHAQQNVPRQGSGRYRDQSRFNTERAIEAMNAIAADDLTHAAAEGLIASPSTMRYLWTLVSRQTLTHDTASFTFEPLLNQSKIDTYKSTLDDDEQSLQATYPVRFATSALVLRPGQHVSVEIRDQIPRENADERASRERENRPLDVPFRMQRSYTPCNTWLRADENPKGAMQMIVKHYIGMSPTTTSEARPPGAGSSYMHSLKVGDVVTTTGARGLFDLESAYETYDTFLLLAGGTGLTPLYAVLRELLRRTAAAVAAAAAASPSTAPMLLPGTSVTVTSQSPSLYPSPSSPSCDPATPRLGRPRKIVLVCALRNECDLLLSKELDELVETHRDLFRVHYIFSAPTISPTNAAFMGQLNMDVLRVVVPTHLQPTSMQISTPEQTERPRANSSLGLAAPGAGGGGGEVMPASSRSVSRARSPTRFTFGVSSRPRGPDSPVPSPNLLGVASAVTASPPPTLGLGLGITTGSNGDLIQVSDRLKAEDPTARTRASIALQQSGAPRKPSLNLVAEGRKALCLVCGPPGFNTTAMGHMYKLGFKRGLANGNGKDLFVF